MDIPFAHSLVEALRGDRCIFGYSGFFPDEHSSRLIELGEAVLSGSSGTVPVKGRLGYVMVEAYQNIVRHRTRSLSLPRWSEGRSMFLLRCHHAGQQVFACNPVTRSQAQKLDKDLADLQSRDKAGLKELYLEGIQRTSKPGSRGAGLGLIEMVRRAGGGATWAFKPVDDRHDLFAFSLELGTTAGADALHLDGPLHRLVLDHRIQLFHVGIWTSGIENVLLGLTRNEMSIAGSDLPQRGAALMRIFDLFRSACDRSKPLLFVLHGGDRMLFSMGGMVDPAKAEELEKHLAGTGATLRCAGVPEEGNVLTTVEVAW